MMQVTNEMQVGADGDLLAEYLTCMPGDKTPGTLWERVAEGAGK